MTWTLEDHLKYYKSQHRTRGCKLTHMVGVPLIFLSFPTLLFNWRAGLKMLCGGWGLQLIGHYIFEKNRPVLFSEGRKPLTIAAAAIFVYDGWARVLTGRPLLEEDEEKSAAQEEEPDREPPDVIDLQKKPRYRRRQAL